MPVDPTARQKLVPTQETELRVSPVVAGASTLGTTAHVVPFHCSIRDPPPAPEFSPPTAMQKVDDVHDTSFNWLKPDPAAALAFVQFVAATVGGLVMVVVPARAGEAPSGTRQERNQRSGRSNKEHTECRHVCPLVVSDLLSRGA